MLREHGADRPALRKAHFVSALCVAWPDGHVEEFEGTVEGTLVWPPRGTAGFGYDPMFLPDGHARTFGEMTSEEKHGLPPKGQGLSHRARAFRKLAAPACVNPIGLVTQPANAAICWRHDGAGRIGLRRLCALAVLPVEVPLLRLQQPCAPRRDRRGALRARVRGRDCRDGSARAADAPSRRIFFGGGTPSLMQPATVGAILDAIGKHWTVAPDAEVTLEANPTSVEATRFRGYRAAGVNRVSLGVQALDDDALKALGRTHTAQEALDAVAIARARRSSATPSTSSTRGPDRRRRPGPRSSSARSRGRRASVALSAHHRARHAVRRAARGRQAQVPDEDTARALYDTTQEVCAAAGLPAYEISNHARPGAECRHNLVYWRGA